MTECARIQWLTRKRWGYGVGNTGENNKGENQDGHSDYEHDPDEHMSSHFPLEISMPIEICHFKMILLQT
jgi:hypothetical protein